MPGARPARACPVPQRLGYRASHHCQALSSGAAAVREPLPCLDLGCSATSPFFNRTKNKKVSHKGLGIQNRCRLVLNLVPFTFEGPAQVCGGRFVPLGQ